MQSTSPKRRRFSHQKIYKQMYYNNWKGNSTVKITSAVEKLFNKRFAIIKDGKFVLPNAESMFTDLPWQIDRLQKLKKELNETKCQLNDFVLMKWHSHTRKRNQAGDIQWRLKRDIDPEMLTQAWSKFYENVSTFQLIPKECLKGDKKLNSLHLCEAPGAFITSLNHYLRTNASGIGWNWLATTLNPHYEGNTLSTMINDDRLILHTDDHWFFGSDRTGDIMKLKILDELVQKAKTMGDVMLITADGSFSCLDMPDEQEAVVGHLHYCETVAALHILSHGGNFLLKIFTMFEHQTICLMYLLSCCFNEITFNKPATSKEGNSEVYVICLGFKGPEYVKNHLETLRKYYEKRTDVPIFLRKDIPETFINHIISAGEFFKNHQCQVIDNNIATFNISDEDFEIKRIKKAVADQFIKKYELKRLAEEMEIVGKRQLGMVNCEIMESKVGDDSYNDRKKKGDIPGSERLKIIVQKIEQIHINEDLVKLELSNRAIPQLNIILAKPYERIQSSRFCIATMLKAFNLAFDVVNELGSDFKYPYEAKKQIFKEEMKRDNKKVYDFQYSLIMDFNIVKYIYEIMEGIREGEDIVLLEYCLLTQLHVGILWLLAHTFESIELISSNEIGCIVNLRNYKYKQQIHDVLKEIHEKMTTAKKNNRVILSIFRMADLCACDLYVNILKMNHGFIKNYINQITKKMNVV